MAKKTRTMKVHKRLGGNQGRPYLKSGRRVRPTSKSIEDRFPAGSIIQEKNPTKSSPKYTVWDINPEERVVRVVYEEDVGNRNPQPIEVSYNEIAAHYRVVEPSELYN